MQAFQILQYTHFNLHYQTSFFSASAQKLGWLHENYVCCVKQLYFSEIVF